MRIAHSFSMLAVALSFGAVALEARPALAVPCCSSSMCQQDKPPLICGLCSDCSFDEQIEAGAPETGYDEVAGVCYEAPPESLTSDDLDASELERDPGCQ